MVAKRGASEPWIGLVHVVPDKPDNVLWTEDFGSSTTGAYVHILAFASDKPSYQACIVEDLAANGWRADEIDEVQEFSSWSSGREVAPELFECAEELLISGEPQFGTWHLYFDDDDTSTEQWLMKEAQAPDRSEAQTRVLESLSRMLEQVDATALDGISLQEEGPELTIGLNHVDDAIPELEVIVGVDHIVVDHGFGHLHFSAGKQQDYLEEAMEFLFGALQGGVRVDAWMVEGELVKSMTYALLEGGSEWTEYSAWASEPDPSFDEPPTQTMVLNFT
ncbi:MAG: hypothetical protein ACT4OM_07140 [Actinomycetota bacterium]